MRRSPDWRSRKSTPNPSFSTQVARINPDPAQWRPFFTVHLAGCCHRRVSYIRGEERVEQELFLYGPFEERASERHPLRPIRTMMDAALESMSVEFDQMYSKAGRSSIAPERLLRALLLQALYSIRSERQLVEQLEYKLLFRWFVGLTMSEPAWTRAEASFRRTLHGGWHAD